MAELIRIGERYINLDQIAGVNLAAEVIREEYDKSSIKHVRTPAVIITLIATEMTHNGDVISQMIEYAQEEYDVVKPWLKAVLDARTVQEIDLPKPKKYVYVAVLPKSDTDEE